MAVKLIAALSFAALGMGNSCGGATGAKATFSSTRFSSSSSVSGSDKYWRAAEIIDIGATDTSDTCARHNQNQPLSSLIASNESLWYYPMAVFNDAAKSFYIGFNREDADADGDNTDAYFCSPSGVSKMNAYVTAKSDVTDGAAWVSSLGDFTQIDVGIGIDSIRPMAAVDSSGNATLVYFAKTAAGAPRRPYATRHNYGSAWTVPTLISDSGNGTDSATAFDVSTSAGIAVDAYSNAVTVWGEFHDTDGIAGVGVGTFEAYFNEYRPFTGWRFSGSTFPAAATWKLAGDTVVDKGMDIGFDSYGNGYGVYVHDTGAATDIKVARWDGSVADNFVDASVSSVSTGRATVGTTGYPRLLVAPDGAATVFFYTNLAGTTGTLWCSYLDATSTSAMGAIHIPGAGQSIAAAVTVQSDSDILRPIVAHSGTAAAMGYIQGGVFYIRKSDGQPNCSNWTSLGGIQIGSQTVTWGDLAINSSGQIAAVMSVADGAGTETVYGAIWDGSAWGTVTRLDDDTTFDPGNPAATADGPAIAAGGAQPLVGPARPSVSIDSSGNAVATFSMPDGTIDGTTYSSEMGSRRRAAMASFR